MPYIRFVSEPDESSSVEQIPKSTGHCCWSVCCCCRPLTCFVVTIIVLYLLAGVYFLLIPGIYMCTVSFQRDVLFLNHIGRSVKSPEASGFNCTDVVRLMTADQIELGVWHIYPTQHCSGDHPEQQNQTVNSSVPTAGLTILYAHGSGGSRDNRHRLEMYHVMSEQLQTNVITFDYRGFGDSTPFDAHPSAQGVTNDTRAVYDWILRTEKPRRVILWGHSLGTAIMVRLLSQLPDHLTPLATVLEAPFTSLREEIPAFPLAKLYNYLPYFEYAFVHPITSNAQLNLDSVALLPLVRSPLLILHSIDDNIIPFRLGKKLYETARKVQPKSVKEKTRMHVFPGGKGYRHNLILTAPELPQVITQFIQSIQ